ncbi:hypothetical protein C8T65DRAFT_828542 [Cerioporus squamosus]|nr:hypothetical protein C8T65DRAFT_828542 [Cerioporus squamosus]
MRLLDLDDDALLSILSYLHGENALNVALTCSKAYHLALPRVAAVLVCNSPFQLRRLHAFLRGHDVRARHVEDLELTISAFYPLDEEVDADFSTRIDGHYIQARLVADILLQLFHAKGLRRLVLHQLHPLVHKDPRIIPALIALDGLTCVVLDTVGDCCITALQGASFSNLQTLSLRFHKGEVVGRDPLIDRQPITYPPLIQLLSLLPKLYSLKLHLFTPDRWLDSRAVSSVPSFSSIRQLEMEEVTPAALNLVQLCPGLAMLTVTLLRGVPEDISIVSHAPRRWPPLRLLRTGGRSELIHIAHLLPIIHRLELIEYICMNVLFGSVLGLVDSDQLLATSRQASPVSASMRLLPDIRPVSFWSQLVVDAPRLRVLDLHIAGSAIPADLASWLTPMHHCLGCLRLVSLSIRLPLDIEHHAHNVFSSLEERRPAERRHATMLIVATQFIRDIIPLAIPTLRFFTLTGAWPPSIAETVAVQSHNGEHGGSWDRTGYAEGPGEVLPEPELDAVEELERQQPCPDMRIITHRWRAVHAGRRENWSCSKSATRPKYSDTSMMRTSNNWSACMNSSQRMRSRTGQERTWSVRSSAKNALGSRRRFCLDLRRSTTLCIPCRLSRQAHIR